MLQNLSSAAVVMGILRSKEIEMYMGNLRKSIGNHSVSRFLINSFTNTTSVKSF